VAVDGPWAAQRQRLDDRDALMAVLPAAMGVVHLATAWVLITGVGEGLARVLRGYRWWLGWGERR